MENYEQETPGWVRRGERINEVEFCQDFVMHYHPLVCVNGVFFDTNGRVADESKLRREIYLVLRRHISSALGPKVDSILNTMRMECHRKELDYDMEYGQYVIPLANGKYSLTQSFSTYKNITRYRLPVAYNPDAPVPERWLQFLRELLHEEDIPTLQEYMGYCLIPTTMGQKMLIITGKGGEGKSRIGVVMKALLGDNMCSSSIAKVEMSPFARADLENMLVMVDDDLKMEALNQTNYIKSIITAELPMDLEKKGIQSYQGQLCVRFLAFGNGNLQSLHDRSHGFFRRQIILTAKERDPNRVDDPYLAQRLLEEIEGILLWCIQGLQRLNLNNFQFTISPRSRNNLDDAVLQGNNVVGFLKSEGYIRFDREGSITSKHLYDIYKDWCSDNMLSPLSPKSFWGYLSQNTMQYGISQSKHIPAGNGREVRGFIGIRACLRM